MDFQFAPALLQQKLQPVPLVFSHLVPSASSAGSADHPQESTFTGTAGSVTGLVSHSQPIPQTLMPGPDT